MVLETDMEVTLVVAVADNGVIGRGNALPWDLPDDLKHFKQTTMGRPIIMGRKTFESIGRPLPGRLNIVLTRDIDWRADGVSTATCIGDAVALAEQQALIDGVDSVMFIGGAEVYRQAMPFCTRAVVTRVHGQIDGDAFFDVSQFEGWTEYSRFDVIDSDENSHNFSVLGLEKV